MDKELVNEVELRVYDHLRSWDEECQGKVEPMGDPSKALKYWLSKVYPIQLQIDQLTVDVETHLRAVVRLKCWLLWCTW